MTPEAQQKAIAEACPQLGQLDYLNSLNAMWEARQECPAFTGTETYRSYSRHLYEQVSDEPYGRYNLDSLNLFDIAHASAEDHAVAFLKTLSLWTD